MHSGWPYALFMRTGHLRWQYVTAMTGDSWLFATLVAILIVYGRNCFVVVLPAMTNMLRSLSSGASTG